jgi:glycosyltransferase involved in cell wall biosynthesis
MPALLEAVPDAQLVVAGAGDDLPRLQAKALEQGVADRVNFLGWASEQQLEWLYSRCALFVMPSEGDGFGLVFLEAMMRRLPCVGLAGGAAAEIFRHGESGILIDRDDREEMVGQLAGLLQDERRRQRIGQAGHERYQSLFSGRHFAARLESILLNELAAVGCAPPTGCAV